MISPETIETAIDRTRATLRIAKFAVPGGAGVVLVGTTVPGAAIVAVPLPILLTAAVVLTVVSYVAGRSANQASEAIAALTAPPAPESDQDEEGQ